MSAAAPLHLEAFDWLPPDMRIVAERWGFGLRPGATRTALHVDGRLWYTDGGCAVASWLAAPSLSPGQQPPRWSWEVTGYVLARVDSTAGVAHEGATVLIGGDAPRGIRPARISAAYHGLVEELWPGVSWGYGLGWWGDELLRYAVALYRRPVALALPVSP